MAGSYPKFRYHQTEAPEGQIFMSAETDPLVLGTDGWVENPGQWAKPGERHFVKPVPEAGTPEAAEAAAEAAAATGPVYPSHRYKKGEPESARRVENADEAAFLEGAEPGVWKSTYDPAAWGPEAAAAPAPGASASAGAPDLPPSTGPVELTDAQRKDYLDATAGDVILKVNAISSLSLLEALTDLENGQPKPRSTVLKAIKARKAAIANGSE